MNFPSILSKIIGWAKLRLGVYVLHAGIMLAQKHLFKLWAKKSLIYAIIREHNQRRRDKDQPRPQGSFPWLCRWKLLGDEAGQRSLFFQTLGSLRNDHGDGNDNGKKAID